MCWLLVNESCRAEPISPASANPCAQVGELIPRTVMESSPTLNYSQMIRLIEGGEMGGTCQSNGRDLR